MKSLSFLILPFFLVLGCQSTSQKSSSIAISVSISEKIHTDNLDGRLLLLLSTNNKTEPRFQIGNGLNNQLIFGVNVDELAPEIKITFNEQVFGYPIESLKDIQPGEYYIQALLHIYETFNLASGQTVKLPMDNGEGQKWNKSPGNLFSKPVKITITERGIENIDIVLDQIVPEIEEPTDTKWIKHIKIRSEKLSEFWGRDMYLGAHILLPKGFDDHPKAKYPLMIFHGHFPSNFGGFRTIPPNADLKPDFSKRFGVDGYNVIQQQEAYAFYTRWNEPDFPRFLIIEIQTPHSLLR